MDHKKRKVIIITDGDEVAKKTIEKVATKVGGCCISASAGNPTPLSGEEIISLIKEARSDPVLVMLDDKGCCSQGKGEKALEYLAKSEEVQLIGVLAVASNTLFTQGVSIDHAITMDGQMIHRPVNKDGEPEKTGHHILEGDTVGILNSLKNQIPMIIGIGDIGKMHGRDHAASGGKITTQAIKYLLKRDGESGDA
ncbi:stage V sporulation protein AE [Dehalobacterium formicoaceticum]|uniref:Stage V sporulation protein AE n=1 Tax=Dehalobacterium formicoaceticum TaxID=51515 RepID=A0ABT1Y4N5_9FIRM|nr:stage V sporulation protein AE [Dehalobacterium formicoaceticum]MCR6545835.1 stage V sporulation protein AE [Dehalobacterium formicoaceticum]